MVQNYLHFLVLLRLRIIWNKFVVLFASLLHLLVVCIDYCRLWQLAKDAGLFTLRYWSLPEILPLRWTFLQCKSVISSDYLEKKKLLLCFEKKLMQLQLRQSSCWKLYMVFGANRTLFVSAVLPRCCSVTVAELWS